MSTRRPPSSTRVVTFPAFRRFSHVCRENPVGMGEEGGQASGVNACGAPSSLPHFNDRNRQVLLWSYECVCPTANIPIAIWRRVLLHPRTRAIFAFNNCTISSVLPESMSVNRTPRCFASCQPMQSVVRTHEDKAAMIGVKSWSDTAISMVNRTDDLRERLALRFSI